MNPTTFAGIIAALSNAQMRSLANVPVNAAEYLLINYLPEELKPNYEARAGTMTVIPVMAGLTGMDSPYLPGGSFELRSLNEPTVKGTLESNMPEAFQREIQGMVQQIQLGNVTTINVQDYLTNQFLNWLQVGIVQGLADLREYMRGIALSTGKIVTTLNGKTVNIDFGLPAANIPAIRTAANGYGGTSSQFWTDIRSVRTKVRGIQAYVMSDDTLEMIINNPANNIIPITEVRSPQSNIRTVTVRRGVTNVAGGITVGFSQDAREAVQLIGYSRKVNLRGADGTLVETAVWPDGVISVIGDNIRTTNTVQGGAIITQNALGHTHIAPTIEGNGVPGNFLNTYTPEARPWEVRAQGAENFLPVIEEPKKLAILKTEVV